MILRAAVSQQIRFFRAFIDVKARLVGFQALHAAAEHNVADGRVRFLFDPREQLVRSSGLDRHPDAGTAFKLFHDGAVNLRLVRGIHHEPVAFLRRERGISLAGFGAADSPCEQEQGGKR